MAYVRVKLDRLGFVRCYDEKGKRIYIEGMWFNEQRIARYQDRLIELDKELHFNGISKNRKNGLSQSNFP